MSEPADEGLEARYREIHRYVRRRRGADVADDVTQQVFLEAASVLDERVNHAGSLGLLYTIAQRRMVDLARSGRAWSGGDDELVALEYEYGPELAGVLTVAIKRLDAAQRDVIILKLLRGLRFSEISELLGDSEAACKMRFSRALKSLRAELEERGVCS
jgi:RNA polymerase sigma-70 factor (ECF subfamily)